MITVHIPAMQAMWYYCTFTCYIFIIIKKIILYL